jgi:protein O-mannosyl-transferase
LEDRKTENGAPVRAAAWWQREWSTYVLLLVLTLAVYSQVWRFEFVNFDDPAYVTQNNHVRAGLTWDGVVWAAKSLEAANWLPLTWLSHMTDVQLFGLRPGWHHWTNVLLHAGATLLLYAALKRMTGARWRSAFVAFLFALHPLHVESVAWVAERKDVLSGFFWCLTLWCYARYAERPSLKRYWPVLAAFCLGLMSKPMIVTLPLVLLLLDVWPLRRANRLSVLWEKVPMLVLAAGESVVTVVAQSRANAVRSLSALPLGQRIENALVAYVTYIARMFWPVRLAAFYPYSHELAAWRVMGALLVLAAICVVVIRRRAREPYLAVGWFWYLGTLAPVIGIIQVGGQSSADRYTYVPMIGLGIMLAWGVSELRKLPPRVMAIGAAAVCTACVALTWQQASYWANSGTLFRHAIEVTEGNYIAHNNLADYYLIHRQNEAARVQVNAALELRPAYPEARVNLATVLSRLGKMSDAEREYRVALSFQPSNVEAHAGLGVVLATQGRMGDALNEFERVVILRPGYADGRYSLGRVLASMGHTDEAMAEFREAVRLRPDHAEAHHSLGVVLASRGRLTEAIGEFTAEARLKPDDANVHSNLGIVLASVGRYDDAIAQFTQALKIQPGLDSARKGLENAMAKRAQE